MRDAKILHASTDGIHVIRYLGWINYTIAPTLRQYFDQVFSQNEVRGVVFDLRRVIAIDSTNLGLLARTAHALCKRSGAFPALIATQPDLLEFLRSMSFHEYFHMVDDHPNDEEGQPLAIEPASKNNLLQTMLDAHKTLASMSDENKVRFSEVVFWLETEEENQTFS